MCSLESCVIAATPRPMKLVGWYAAPRVPPQTPSDPERGRIVPVLGIGSAMIRFYRTPLKLPGQIIVPGAYWFGVRCTAASISGAQTQRDAAPAFWRHRSAVRGVYVVVWSAWRDAPKVIQPDTVPRRRRHGIALIWKYRSRDRWRGGRLGIALETREPIRELARASFLWVHYAPTVSC